MNRGDDMRSADEIFRDALPSISFAPVNETPKPSGTVLGREFYHDSVGRTILGNAVTDQMGGGANAPSDEECECVAANLLEVYYTTSATITTGTIILGLNTSGPDCKDFLWSGENDNGDLGTLVLPDVISPKWILAYDIFGTVYTLEKDTSGGCDIESPIGSYGGGIAVVSDDPF